jgi:surface adhesion protein
MLVGTDNVDIAADGTGSIDINTEDRDVYQDGQEVTVTVTGVTGGNYELVDISGATDTASVTDINVDGEDT